LTSLNRSSRINIALPSGQGFGWGNCGRQLSKRLGEKGANIIEDNPKVGFNKLDGSLLQAVSGPDFGYTRPILADLQFGYGFIENNLLALEFLPLADRLWNVVISGSSWMMNVLSESERFRDMNGGVCVQGVDPSVFSFDGPTHRAKDEDIFTVGSFGKFEYRKGQDVVIKAFKLFKMRHSDVRLVHCWGNLWPSLITDMASIPDAMVKPPVLSDAGYYSTGMVFDDILEAEGISSKYHFKAINQDEYAMAALYRACDVALFPNRCEAGTNLALHEALACGLPCIATDATGHTDLTRADGYPCDELLLTGGANYVHKVGDVEIGTWHKPCLEEILSQLEYAYRNRDELKAKRKEISEWGSQWTWDRSAEKMATLIGL